MVAEELRGMSAAEIGGHVRDLREQLFKLRFQKTTGQVESAARLSVVRRDIARALTVARERELAGAEAPAAATAGSEEQA
jgi:large subunit ribosomal protein L29